jgi:hypothetical protein
MSLSLRPEVQALVRVRPVVEEFARNFVSSPGCGLYARFYQAKPAPVVGTTKCPESLCLMLALPPSGRRGPPPPRSLLLGLRSYGLMRQSRVALLYFGHLASSSPSPGPQRIGFPLLPAKQLFRGSHFETADIPLRSSLRVCSPPRLFLPLCIRPQGS